MPWSSGRLLSYISGAKSR